MAAMVAVMVVEGVAVVVAVAAPTLVRLRVPLYARRRRRHVLLCRLIEVISSVNVAASVLLPSHRFGLAVTSPRALVEPSVGLSITRRARWTSFWLIRAI